MLAGLIFRALGATVYVVFVFHVVGSGASPLLESDALVTAAWRVLCPFAVATANAMGWSLRCLISLVQFYRAFPTVRAVLPSRYFCPDTYLISVCYFPRPNVSDTKQNK